MATFEERYTTAFDYVKHVTDVGTVTVINRINQKNNQSFPLMHAADISIGDNEDAANRLNIKLQTLDTILRELYGDIPSTLESYTDGRSALERQALAADNGDCGTLGLQGMESLARLAQILNNRTETVDDRIVDLKMYKTITIGASANSTADTEEDAETTDLIADTNHDSLAISALNKWIVLNADDETDSFTIGHYIAAFDPTTSDYDFNTTVTNSVAPAENQFVIQIFDYDAAGHIISKDTKTYTLPNNYKAFMITNSNATTAITTASSPDKVIAQNILGEMTLAAGNKWIELASDNINQTITIGHSTSILTAGEHATNWMARLKVAQLDGNNQPVLDANNNPVMIVNNQEPKFGEIFKILVPEISFTTDAAGHVIGYSNDYIEPTIKIPQGSIATASGSVGNVMVGLTLTQNTMAFERSFEYIANLTLTEYAYPNDYTKRLIIDNVQQAETYTVAASDALKVAIAKLQGYAISNHNAIDTEVANRELAIRNLINGASTGYDTLKGLEDKVKDAQQAADDAQQAADDAQSDIDDHKDDTNNPHGVTTTQIGAMKQAASWQSTNANKVAIWNAQDELAISNYTIETSVPQNAVFTDTVAQEEATATNSLAGFVKLYTTADPDQDDGAISSAAMVQIINDTVNAAIANLFSNFDMSTVHFIMPTSVTWSVETIDGNDYLAYEFDSTFENGNFADAKVYIKKVEESTWNLVTEPVAAEPGEYQIRVVREIEGVKQDVWTATNTKIIEAPEPEEPEEP